MSNPYTPRGPVSDPRMFYGRVEPLNEIAAFLANDQSVSIIGPAKIGKTSMLQRLTDRDSWPPLFPRKDSLFVTLDCEAVGDRSSDEVFRQMLADTTVALEGSGLEHEPQRGSESTLSARMAAEGTVRSLNQRGLRVVIVIDEFERLSANPHLEADFFNGLRSLATRYQLGFITASTCPLIELTYSNRAEEIVSSPFFNIFAPVFIGLLEEADARALIREPMRAAGAPLAPTLEDFIYELVGGHPWALQVACFHGYRSPDRERVERLVVSELQSHFHDVWQKLSTVEQDVLCRLSNALQRELDEATVRIALRDLVQKCLLLRDGQSYRYPSRAWAEFVAARCGVTDVLAGHGVGG